MAEWPGKVEQEQWPGVVYDEEQEYLATIAAKKAEIAAGKSIRRLDPNQPAFSEQAEMLRQDRAIDRANGVPPGRETIPQQALAQSTTSIPAIPPARDLLSTYQSYRPDWTQGAQGVPSDPLAMPGHILNDLGRTGMNILGEAVAPFATARDFIQGVTTGMPGQPVNPHEMGNFFGGTEPGSFNSPPSTDWRQNVIPAIIETLDEFAIPFPQRGILGVGRQRIIEPISPVGSLEVPIGDVDVAIGARSPKTVSGTPDLDAPGPRVEETGRTIAQQAQVPADFPNEQYTLFNPEPVAPNTRLLQPEEQLGIGEAKLRPQVSRTPGFPEESTSEAMRPVTETLQKMSKREVWKQHLRDLHTPQQDYRIKLQTSPRGSASVVEAEVDSGLRYSNIPEAPSDIPLVFPGWPSRVTQSITDTLRQVGPAGRNIANSMDTVLSNRAILTSSDTIETVNHLKQVAGTRGTASKVIEGFRELTHGENAFIWGSHRYFNLSNSEIEQAYNYMYTKGRMVPASTKAKAWADKLYEGMLLPASRAAHEANLDLYNPLTGKHEPFGAPSMFMPQIPEKAVSIKGISDTHLELLYNKQGGMERTGKSFPMWKAQLNRILSQGGELREAKAAEAGMDEASARYDIASKRYKGLEVTRLLDLEALGGSPYQWAMKLGYGTDPFRNAFRFNSSAYLRTEWAKAMPQIETDVAAIAQAGGTDLTEWTTKAIERAQGIHTGLTETNILRNLVKGVRDFNNVTMLQLGGLGSLPQLGYALGRAPLTRSMLGAVDFVVGHNKAVIEKSGAIFPTVMNLITQPEGPLATVSTGALRMYGVSSLDKWSRYFGAHIGNRYVDFLESSLLKYPQKERLHKLVEEMGGNVNQIMKEGKIPEAMRLSMIQRYANYSAGIPDARGLPLIATSETAYARLGNQYRTFMFNNQAELVRLWRQAPTTHDAINRVTKVLLGTGATAAVTGAVSEYIRNAFTEEEGSPFVNKRLKKIVGDEGAAFAIQTLTYGLGALFGSLILTTLDNGWKLAANLTLGPTAGLIAGTAEDTVDSIINGPNWKSLRTASRRVPFVGPVLAPTVRENIKEEADSQRREQQLRRALMPQSGFDNEF